jgi:hypothetical protein
MIERKGRRIRQQNPDSFQPNGSNKEIHICTHTHTYIYIYIHTYGCNNLGSGCGVAFFNGPEDGPVRLDVAVADDDDVSTSMTLQSRVLLAAARPLLPSVKWSSVSAG